MLTVVQMSSTIYYLLALGVSEINITSRVVYSWASYGCLLVFARPRQRALRVWFVNLQCGMEVTSFLSVRAADWKHMVPGLIRSAGTACEVFLKRHLLCRRAIMMALHQVQKGVKIKQDKGPAVIVGCVRGVCSRGVFAVSPTCLMSDRGGHTKVHRKARGRKTNNLCIHCVLSYSHRAKRQQTSCLCSAGTIKLLVDVFNYTSHKHRNGGAAVLGRAPFF